MSPLFSKKLKPSFRLLGGVLAASVAALTAIPSHALAADEEGGGEYLEKLTGASLHGFANMGFADDNSTDHHRRYAHGFYLNNFDLYYNPDVGNRMRFLSEVVFEPDANTQQPTFDAERLQAGYVVSNNLTAWIGRFHTPIGYYVIAYHHGMQLQTAVEKPRFLDFEDHYGVVPVHTNGLWLNGNFTVGEQRFALMGWMGNADRLTSDGQNFTSLDFNMAHTQNFHFTYGARANWVASGSLDGLQVGATVLGATIDYLGQGQDTYGTTGGTPDTTTNPNTGNQFTSKFLMYGAHATFESHGIEFLNELYGFSNSATIYDGSGGAYQANKGNNVTSFAGYSQLAYWIDGMNAPYVRFERANFNQNDPFFAAQYNGLPYTKWAGGYRFNLNDNAALKLEISRTTFHASSATNTGQSYSTGLLDYSVRF